MKDEERGGYRLCTEAELKAGGSQVGYPWCDGGPVTFDDELEIKWQAESGTTLENLR